MGVHYVEFDGVNETTGLTLDVSLAVLHRKVPFNAWAGHLRLHPHLEYFLSECLEAFH